MIGATEENDMGKKNPTGKRLRLAEYDYSETGAYFVTFCTRDRKPLLSLLNPGKDDTHAPELHLSSIGSVVQTAILQIPNRYSGVTVDQYIIMPNHVHLLLWLPEQQSPKLGRIIQQLKGYVTKQCGQTVWQDKYYDHIIRNEKDYLVKCQYIQNNPAKWLEDEYYDPSFSYRRALLGIQGNVNNLRRSMIGATVAWVFADQ